VYPDDVNWPVEHTTYTAAAVILAADALARCTPASGLMAGTTFPPDFTEIGLLCGCATDGGDSADGVPGVAAHAP
jgi:hypothetical protein